MELDPQNNMAVKKTYIYVYPPGRANGQILAQHDGSYTASRYFYLHDRLGSVRQVINTSGNVVNYYTYNPFGETIESGGSLANSFMFTGQYFDSEINEYYLRARQYDPHIGRFTSRDPVFGNFKEPLTLHKYLYCISNPMNRVDPSGEFANLLMPILSATWGRGKDMAASMYGYMRSRDAIVHISAFANAMYSGAMNMYTGPENVSGGYLFGIGFAAGAAEIYVGARAGATAGGAMAEAITSTLNQWASHNLWSLSAAGDILVNTLKGGLVGRFADWYDPDDAKEVITLFLISFDRQMCDKVCSDFVKWIESLKL